ncbi:MAG TPA: lytic murein transglycosylase [Gaiellaceae bacterium]
MRRLALVALAATLLASPAHAETIAQRLVRADAELHASLAGWDGRSAIPGRISRAELAFQKLELGLEPGAIPPLPEPLASRVRADVLAHAALARLTRPRPLSAFRPGPPAPAATLLAHYRAAERRFGVPWNVLAAVNLVESGFGRLRETSVAGAQGPMQFMPATWRAYGLGGNVHDPADAIVGAANYLHANGAPDDLRSALYHYNPSGDYMDAVLRYAGQIRRGRESFLSYYARHLFVRTPAGLRRLTAAKVRLTVQARRLRIDAPAYRLTLDRRTGQVLDLYDVAGRAHLVGQVGCLWGADAAGDPTYYGGCGGRMTYRWDKSASTLTLTYSGSLGAVVTVTATAAWIDLDVELTNGLAKPVRRVEFPADLVGRTATVEAGYAPNYLPGVRLAPAFFSRVGGYSFTYPSRWAFADYLALDLAGGHLALSTVNPAPSPIAPAELGFVHNPAPHGCSGPTFCLTHDFYTWVDLGDRWQSPTVRLRIGRPVEQTILDYRIDNKIDAYPSLEEKLGPRLDTLVHAPLIKADLWKGLHPFAEWKRELGRLPSPALLHPVAFQLHGHDQSDPDFLPPDPVWGSTADLEGAVSDAHAHGLLVMPYLNVSWWTIGSSTVNALSSISSVAALDAAGQPLIDRYAALGYAVSPFVPAVKRVVSSVLDQWRTEVPADCIFLDQIGARSWRYDFNPAAPTPLAYYDGWLALLRPYADRCVMVEDGWDRLAATAVGFHGSALAIEREHRQPDELYGAGNWQPWPLALWLFHDKVLTYQHDLYDGTMTADSEVLTWNMAFGNVLSYSWDDWHGTLESPWLQLVAEFQRALGPLYAGKPLTAWKVVSDGVTESDFGSFTVVANWGSSAYQGIAPQGFLARGPGVQAGAFTGSFGGVPLSSGAHYLLIEGADVRQPVGADTDLGVPLPAGAAPRVRVLTPAGVALEEVPSRLVGDTVVFHYASSRSDGTPISGYRIG